MTLFGPREHFDPVLRQRRAARAAVEPRVCDERDRDVPAGTVGEILVRG